MVAFLCVLGPNSQKSPNFSGLFGLLQLPLSLFFRPSNFKNPLSSSYIKNVLKDQLFKTSGLQLDNWLFGPEKLSGLSQNQPRSQGLSFSHKREWEDERRKSLKTRLSRNRPMN